MVIGLGWLAAEDDVSVNDLARRIPSGQQGRRRCGLSTSSMQVILGQALVNGQDAEGLGEALEVKLLHRHRRMTFGLVHLRLWSLAVQSCTPLVAHARRWQIGEFIQSCNTKSGGALHNPGHPATEDWPRLFGFPGPSQAPAPTSVQMLIDAFLRLDGVGATSR